MYLKTCPTCQSRYPVEFEVCPQDGMRLESEAETSHVQAEWPSGKIISGKYRISSKLGEDEVTTIYEARTLALNAPRVIRVLQPRLAADVGACDEFRKAADLLQKAAQANVIAVEGRGNTEDGRPFLATEFVRGRTLAELLRAEGPLEPLRACALIRQVALALGAAHRLGLLHLGLTPSNILVSGTPDEESVKVQGFGAAYVRMGRSRNGRASSSGPTLGDHLPLDPRYASPEIVLGKAPELLDERSDLYSLGAVFYEMVTGRLPFASPEAGLESGAGPSTDLAVLVGHLEDSPAPLSAGYDGREIPEPLAALVIALLERRPELRVASAREVIERIALAETRIAAVPKPELQPQPIESKPARPDEPAPAQAPASAPPKPAEEPVTGSAPEPSLAPAPSAVASLETLELKPGAGAITTPKPAAIPAVEAPVAAPPVVAESLGSGRDAHSILFKTEEPPGPSHFGRWALAAAAALIVAAGAWFFITRARTQWLGAGPLSPIKSDELRSVEGANPSASAPSAPNSKPAQSQSAPVQTQTGAPSPVQPASAPPGANAQAAGGARTGGAAPAARSGTTSTPSKPVASAASASPNAPPALSPEDLAAEVKRAVAAGDVFFELGQYDYAIRAYQGPLKDDPNNLELKLKIERARKAKAAEEQYLGQ